MKILQEQFFPLMYSQNQNHKLELEDYRITKRISMMHFSHWDISRMLFLDDCLKQPVVPVDNGRALEKLTFWNLSVLQCKNCKNDRVSASVDRMSVYTTSVCANVKHACRSRQYTFSSCSRLLRITGSYIN